MKDQTKNKKEPQKSSWVHQILPFVSITFIYLIVLFFKTPQIFSYQFNPSLVEKYLCSQDIPYEPPCKRLFLSDGDIHIAASYLYARGSDPTAYNFQHPPLIKYLYGFSILLFNNPYFMQILLGILLLLFTYILSLKVFRKVSVSFLACLLLIIDPLFINLSASALLDLGQAVLLFFYFLLMLYYKENFFLQGVALGLLFTAKFWGGSLFFVFILASYLLYKHELNLKKYFFHLLIAFIVFSLVYIRTFLDKNGFFNIIFFEFKVLKYWFSHSVASIFGSSIFLFLTGYLQSWWGKKSLIKTDTWFLMWPLLFLVSIQKLILMFIKKQFNKEFLIVFIPVGYLIYLGVQAPFARYFILVLPFFYMILANNIFKTKLTKSKKLR